MHADIQNTILGKIVARKFEEIAEKKKERRALKDVGTLEEMLDKSAEINKLETKDLWLAFIYIGFSNKERRKTKPLHKKWNTTTIIGIQNFNPKK